MEETVEVPVEILAGLFKIACGLSSNASHISPEWYRESLPGIENSRQWVLEHGKKNKYQSR